MSRMPVVAVVGPGAVVGVPAAHRQASWRPQRMPDAPVSGRVLAPVRGAVEGVQWRVVDTAGPELSAEAGRRGRARVGSSVHRPRGSPSRTGRSSGRRRCCGPAARSPWPPPPPASAHVGRDVSGSLRGPPRQRGAAPRPCSDPELSVRRRTVGRPAGRRALVEHARQNHLTSLHRDAASGSWSGRASTRRSRATLRHHGCWPSRWLARVAALPCRRSSPPAWPAPSAADLDGAQSLTVGSDGGSPPRGRADLGDHERWVDDGDQPGHPSCTGRG